MLNLSKSRWKIINFVISRWNHSHWVRDGCSAIIFVKHVKTVFVQVLSLVHNTVRTHELLLGCESSCKCHHAAQTTPTWTKTTDMCYKIDCCAGSIHGQIWMNNVPNESCIIMLSCTDFSFVISFFDFEKFGVKLKFPFFKSLCIVMGS